MLGDALYQTLKGKCEVLATDIDLNELALDKFRVSVNKLDVKQASEIIDQLINTPVRKVA